MIIQPIEETSVAAKSVASAVFQALMTKLVEASIVPIVIMPKAAAQLDKDITHTPVFKYFTLH